MKRTCMLLWLIAASLAWVVAISTPAASAKNVTPTPYVLPGPGPGGEECEVSDQVAYNLQNSIHPGEIGFRTFLGCNQGGAITIDAWLNQYIATFGQWFLLAGTESAKIRQNVLGLSLTTWYSCTGGLSAHADQLYRESVSYTMQFGDGYRWQSDGNNFTPSIYTRCLVPKVVEFY